MTYFGRLQRFILFLFLFSINFENWEPFNTLGYLSISKFIGIIYLFTMIPTFIFATTSYENKSLLRLLWLFFGLLTIVSLFNISSHFSNFIDFTILQNIILFWILINHERYDYRVLEKGMLSFALGSVALALFFNAGIGIEYNTEGRVSIFGDNQNNIGIRMSTSMVILILAVLQNRLQIGKIRYLLLLPIPLLLILMMETGSRIALISFFLSFITGGLLFKTKRLSGKFLVLAIGLIAIIFIGKYVITNEVMRQRLFQSAQEGDLGGRDFLWKTIIPLIKSNPIVGVGKTGYAFFSQSTFSEVDSPHNVFLELLCYTGITGLFIFLIFLYRIFVRSYQTYKTDGLLLPIILTIPIIGMMISSHILEVKIGWVIFAYITSSSTFHSIKNNDSSTI